MAVKLLTNIEYKMLHQKAVYMNLLAKAVKKYEAKNTRIQYIYLVSIHLKGFLKCLILVLKKCTSLNSRLLELKQMKK